MKKWIKIVLIVLVSIVLAAAAGALVIRSGRLVRPGAKALAQMTAVPEYDILQWQAAQEQAILADYAQGDYSFQSPYVFVDPYEMNPLSALVIFDSDAPGAVQVTVAGKDDHTTLQYVKTNCAARCEVPVLGLYAGIENQVTLEDASGQQTVLSITTEPLPTDFQQYQLVVSQPDKMEPGITLFTACFEHSYTALLDTNGDVRGYLSQQRMGHGTSMTVLQNGHLLATGDEYRQIPYNMLTAWELNWLGKIFAEYHVPNGIHHDLRELPDGNFLAVSNHINMFESGTREDMAIIIDRQTGLVIREYDFRTILDENREMYHHFDPDILNAPNKDWMHMNTALYDEEHNAIIVSSPTQSQVVSIDADSEAINWILGPHEQYGGSSAFMQPFLLTPIGEGFEWAWTQHQPMILPDLDQNPDTIDLLVFDNGQSKSSEEATAVAPADNYSRGVHFRINTAEMTVEQLWQWGKECGSDCYASFLGDANYLEQSGNILITFGGQLRMNGEPTDAILSGVFGVGETISRVVEVTESGEVVYEIASTPGQNDSSAETYQAKRIQFYIDQAFEYSLGAVTAERLGVIYSDQPETEMLAPNFFINQIGVEMVAIYVNDNRLVIDGYLGFADSSAVIGRAFVALSSPDSTYSFQTRAALNGRFFTTIDLSELPDGEYQLSVYGAVSNDRDAQTTNLVKGHIKTGYKVIVAND